MKKSLIVLLVAIVLVFAYHFKSGELEKERAKEEAYRSKVIKINTEISYYKRLLKSNGSIENRIEKINKLEEAVKINPNRKKELEHLKKVLEVQKTQADYIHKKIDSLEFLKIPY